MSHAGDREIQMIFTEFGFTVNAWSALSSLILMILKVA